MASYDDIEVSFTYGKTCMSYKEPSKLLRQYIYIYIYIYIYMYVCPYYSALIQGFLLIQKLKL
jgi:hypothetical protein